MNRTTMTVVLVHFNMNKNHSDKQVWSLVVPLLAGPVLQHRCAHTSCNSSRQNFPSLSVFQPLEKPNILYSRAAPSKSLTDSVCT